MAASGDGDRQHLRRVISDVDDVVDDGRPRDDR